MVNHNTIMKAITDAQKQSLNHKIKWNICEREKAALIAALKDAQMAAKSEKVKRIKCETETAALIQAFRNAEKARNARNLAEKKELMRIFNRR